MTSAEKPVKVSVIIPARNEEKFLAQCLNSLAQMKYPREALEVILVDNGSQDRTIEIAQQHAAALPLRILQKPGVHISELRNLGAAEATGEVFAFLDADCTVSEDWLFGVANALRTETTGVVGAEMLMPVDASWVSRIWFWKGREKRGEVGYVGTANLSVRRDVFLLVGGYDGSLETNEDCEFCFRVHAAGFQILAIPQIAVVHLRVPVKLSDFYRKQRWHGTHTFRVFLRNFPSLANLRAVIFAIWTLAAILGLCAGAVLALAGWGWGRALLFGSAAAILLPPALLSAQGIRNGKPLKHLPAMLLLYLTYGIARALCLLDLKNWIGQGERTASVTKAAGSTST